MNVQNCMTTKPVTAHPELRASETLELMKAHGAHHLPVVEDDGRFVGIVSRHEIERVAAGAAEEARECDILGMVELGTPTLRPDETTEHAWELMARAPGLNPLPVVQGGRLVGTVSQRGLLRALAGLTKQDGNPPRAPVPRLSEWASRSTPAILRSSSLEA